MLEDKVNKTKQTNKLHPFPGIFFSRETLEIKKKVQIFFVSKNEGTKGQNEFIWPLKNLAIYLQVFEIPTKKVNDLL